MKSDIIKLDEFLSPLECEIIIFDAEKFKNSNITNNKITITHRKLVKYSKILLEENKNFIENILNKKINHFLKCEIEIYLENKKPYIEYDYQKEDSVYSLLIFLKSNNKDSKFDEISESYNVLISLPMFLYEIEPKRGDAILFKNDINHCRKVKNPDFSDFFSLRIDFVCE